MKISVRMLWLLTVIPSLAFAGGGGMAGNGGDAVACYDSTGKISSVEFFDLFEGRMIYALVPKLGAGSPREKVHGVARKISTYFPNFAAALIDHADHFLADSEMVRTDLEDIPDAGDVIFPTGCRIQQAIIRSSHLPYPGKRFVIDERLWDLMDADSQAAAILHEFVYGWAVDKYGHKNSVNARYVNEHLMSDEPTEPGALIDWAGLFLRAKLGIEESYASSLSNFRIEEDGNQETLVSYWVNSPLDLPTSRGLRRLRISANSGEGFTLSRKKTSSGWGEVIASGFLREPTVFSTPVGDIEARDQFKEYFTPILPEWGPILVLGRTLSRFTRLDGSGLAITSENPACLWEAQSYEVRRLPDGNHEFFLKDILSRDSYSCRLRIDTPTFSIEHTTPQEIGRAYTLVRSGRLSAPCGTVDLSSSLHDFKWQQVIDCAQYGRE